MKKRWQEPQIRPEHSGGSFLGAARWRTPDGRYNSGQCGIEDYIPTPDEVMRVAEASKREVQQPKIQCSPRSTTAYEKLELTHRSSSCKIISSGVHSCNTSGYAITVKFVGWNMFKCQFLYFQLQKLYKSLK